MTRFLAGSMARCFVIAEFLCLLVCVVGTANEGAGFNVANSGAFTVLLEGQKIPPACRSAPQATAHPMDADTDQG